MSSSQLSFHPISERGQSRSFPTASDILTIKQAKKWLGSFATEDSLVYCRDICIGALRITTYRQTSDMPTKPILTTLRFLPDGSPGPSITSHDIEWLLREHIDHDLGGRQQRLATIVPGTSFIAKSAFMLNPRELRNSTNWYVPMMGRLDVIAANHDEVVFRWNIAYTPLDVLPRRDEIHNTTDVLPRNTFEHLVAERLLMPM